MSRNRLPRSVRNQFRRIRGSVSRTGNSVNAYVRATQMRAQQETQNRLNAVQQRARTEARELERASRERLRNPQGNQGSVNSSNTANSSASNWTAELNRFAERNYYLIQAVVGGVSITTSLYTVFAGERMRRLTEAENSRNEDLRNEASSLIEEGRAILRRIEAGAQQQQEERQRQQSIERDSSSRFQRVWSFISGAVWTIRNAIDIFTIFDYRNNGSNGADSSNNSNNTNNEQNSSANFPSDGGQVLGKKPFPSDDRNAGNG